MASLTHIVQGYFTDTKVILQLFKHDSPGAKMGTWKCLRVQCFMIDPEFIGVLKEIKLGCHDGNLGELFLNA